MSDAKQKSTNQKKLAYQDDHITALKKLLVYYKEITETIREPFIILNKDLYVVTANRAFYRKFKVSKKETEGRHMYELGDNQWNVPELRELLEHILPKRRVLNKYEITLDFPNLGRKTMLLNARQVDSKQLILLAVEDVTEKRTLQITANTITSNLIKQRDQLQGLNDAKDEFISLASHQLRTPATVVKQYVGMLTHGYAGKMSKDQEGMLNVAYANNESQLEIIEDLLGVAKADAGEVYLEKSLYDVVQQVEAVIENQAILFKTRRQSVVLNKPSKQTYVFIDPKLMLTVFENILDNAGKYSQPGTQITIDIEQNASETSISVNDSGIGIRKKDRQKLFQKFSRIDNPLSASVKGTGLGLYWAKKVVDLHEGTIEVTSKLNEGSTFIVKTPIDNNHLLNQASTTVKRKVATS
jgi:two-component system CheB/CheR fusion protein